MNKYKLIDPIVIGERIKDYRIYMSLSRDELASKLNIDIRTLYRYEKGENISIALINDFNSLLECNLLQICPLYTFNTQVYLLKTCSIEPNEVVKNLEVDFRTDIKTYDISYKLRCLFDYAEYVLDDLRLEERFTSIINDDLYNEVLKQWRNSLLDIIWGEFVQ